MKWKVICINKGIETTQETNDLNEFFENAGIDREDYGDDLFKIEILEIEKKPLNHYEEQDYITDEAFLEEYKDEVLE